MLICVTNRQLCRDDFLQRIDRIAAGNPHAIMLREKDLTAAEYEDLAAQVKEICRIHQVRPLINQQLSAAVSLQMPYIHLSMENLRKYQNELHAFKQIGASVHSLEEALEAQELGASYLIAGHIFETNSKKGIPPKGIFFLREVCHHTSVPVFAIGGITRERARDAAKAGAEGVCIMSEAMTTSQPSDLANQYTINY